MNHRPSEVHSWHLTNAYKKKKCDNIEMWWELKVVEDLRQLRGSPKDEITAAICVQPHLEREFGSL